MNALVDKKLSKLGLLDQVIDSSTSLSSDDSHKRTLSSKKKLGRFEISASTDASSDSDELRSKKKKKRPNSGIKAKASDSQNRVALAPVCPPI